LQVFEEEAVLDSIQPRIGYFRDALKAAVARSPHFGGFRQVGLAAGIDLIDAATGVELDWRKESGARVCREARKYGLLTRPVRDTLTLIPPLCSTDEQIGGAVAALEQAATDLLG
jgi:adenosylmethionine-8-amino-7-oxononanoate aminotransferase